MTSLDIFYGGERIKPFHVAEVERQKEEDLRRERERERAARQQADERVVPESWTLFDYVKDVGAGLERGTEGFVKSLVGLVDAGAELAGMDLVSDEWLESRLVQRPESIIGSFAEPMTQFLWGFVPVAGWIGKGAKVGLSARYIGPKQFRIPGVSRLSYAAQEALKKQGRSAAAVGTEMARAATAGAVADFVAFDGHENRLSNVLKGTDWENPVSQFLAADEEDPELVGRLKNVLEGALLGTTVDALFAVLRPMKRLRAAREKLAEKYGPHPPREEIEKINLEAEEAIDHDQIAEAARKQARADEEKALEELPPEAKPLERVSPLDQGVGDVAPPPPTGKSTLTQPDPGAPVYQKELPDGSKVLVEHRLPEGQKRGKKRWYDKETGEQLGDTRTTKRSVEDEIEARWRKSQAQEEGVPDLGEPARTEFKGEKAFDRESVKETLRNLAVRSELPDQASNPRWFSPEELMDRALEANDINLSHFDGDEASLIRSISDTYKDSGVIDDWIRRRGDEEVMKKAQSTLADYTGDDRPLFLIADESVRNVNQAAADMLAMQTMLRHNIRSQILLSKEIMEAAPEVAEGLKNRLVYLEAKNSLLGGALRGIQSASGRLLRANRIKFHGHSGRFKKIDTLVDHLSRLDPSDPMQLQSAAGLIREANRPGFMDWLNEFFIGNALGSGRTQVTALSSNISLALNMPFEQLLGSWWSPKIAKEAYSAAFEVGRLAKSTADAVGIAWDSIKLDDTTFVDATSKANEASLRGNVISGENSGWVFPRYEKNAAGDFVPKRRNTPSWAESIFDYVGTVTRVGGRVMTGTDQAARYATYISSMESMLNEKFLLDGLDPETAAEMAGQGVQKYLHNKQVVSENVLRQKHLEQIRKSETDTFPDEMAQLREAQRRGELEFSKLKSEDEWALHETALGYGDEVTLQTKLKRGENLPETISTMVQQAIREHPLLLPFAPFIKTPFNVLRWAHQRSFDPITAGMQWMSDHTFGSSFLERSKSRLVQEFRGDIDLRGIDPDSVEAQVLKNRAARAARGKVSTALGITALTYSLVYKGQITGAGPTDPEQRKLLTEAGWLPYSLKIGDGYVQYKRADPIATMIGTIADAYTVGRYLPPDQQEGMEGMTFAMITALANNVTNKTYMMGIKNLLDLLLNPSKAAGRVARDYVSITMPIAGHLGYSEIGQMVAGDDRHMREVRSMADAMLAKVPYFGAENLEPVRNFLGEPVKRTQSLGADTIGSVMNLLIPVAYRETNDHILMKELALLDHPFRPPRSKQGGVNLLEFRQQNGRTAYDRMLELRQEVRVSGKTLRDALRELVRSPEYQKMDPRPTEGVESPRVREVTSVIGRYHRAAVNRLHREMPEVYREILRRRQEFQAKRSGVFDFEGLTR